MAVPSSGELSLLGISREMLEDDYNGSNNNTDISLVDMGSGTSPYIIDTTSASYPNSAAPHSMSEFYSYDNDASNLPSFLSSAKGATGTVCSLTQNVTLYHDGAGTFPTVGDNVFSDAVGTNAVEGGWYRAGTGKIEIKVDFTFPTPIHTGEVLSVGIC